MTRFEHIKMEMDSCNNPREFILFLYRLQTSVHLFYNESYKGILSDVDFMGGTINTIVWEEYLRSEMK